MNIIKGDALNECKKIKDNFINLIIIDPPYVLKKEQWDKFDVINDDLIHEFYRILKDTGSLYCWCGIGEKSQSLINWFPIFSKYFYFKDLITWKKNRGIGMRKGWLYVREEIMWFVKDNKKFVWNVDKQYSNEKRPWNVYKKGGEMVNKSEYKRLTNVWTDINEVGFGSCPKKYKSFRKHSTPKPYNAIERIIQLHTKENDMILDCFAGSGVVGDVCKNNKLNFILIDKNNL